MKQWISKNFIILLIIAILAVLLIRKCGNPVSVEPKVTIVRDTVVVTHDSIIQSVPVIVTRILPGPKEIPKPDTSYTGLLRQYSNLAEAHFTKNIERDTLKIDSIGEVRVEDTVQANRITSRKYDYNIRERIITNTVTITNPSKRQVYYGFQAGIPDHFSLAGLYKDRRDRIIGASIGYNFVTHGPQYGISFYSKLKLK
jgi:hypothetical protein